MSNDINATAAQIIHRQASSSRQNTRSYSFAATVANRFFSDNSLARQKRLIECTKRRQARAKAKTLEQEHRLKQLQLEHEHALQLKVSREQRETSRMERKLQHAAAAYIQYIWRKYRYFAAEQQRKDQSSRFLADFIVYRMYRKKYVRLQSSFRIQREWRAYSCRLKHKKSLSILQNFLIRLIRVRRVERLKSAIRIQRWFRRLYWQRRANATRVLHRVWRRHLSKRKIKYFSRAYRHMAHLKRLDTCARILQRALGRRAAYCRLIQHREFAEYDKVVNTPSCPCVDMQSLIQLTDNKRILEEVALSKRLGRQEASLTSGIEDLQQRIKQATAKRDSENEKVRRFEALESYRRIKDEGSKQQQLQELETKMRREIRLEIEKELEIARRVALREKKLSSARFLTPQIPSNSKNRHMHNVRRESLTRDCSVVEEDNRIELE